LVSLLNAIKIKKKEKKVPKKNGENENFFNDAGKSKQEWIGAL